MKTLYTLRDTSTAESYASSGGLTGVVGTKIGVNAAEGCGLSDWSGWFAKGGSTAGVKEENGVHNDDMLKMLLEVYMEDGWVSSFWGSSQVDKVWYLQGYATDSAVLELAGEKT